MLSVLKKVQVASANLVRKARCLLCGDQGDFYISEGVKVIIAVVLGALLLAAMTLLFNGTIIPKITQAITDLFS